MNLHFSLVGLLTKKSLFAPSLFNLSISYLSISNPSLSKPSVSSPRSVWWLKQKEWLLTICVADFKRAGQKVEGILLFVPLWLFYAVLFVPLFCHLREKCGTLWKTIWLHNVDNIRQKDINIFKGPFTSLCWGEGAINGRGSAWDGWLWGGGGGIDG